MSRVLSPSQKRLGLRRFVTAIVYTSNTTTAKSLEESAHPCRAQTVVDQVLSRRTPPICGKARVPFPNGERPDARTIDEHGLVLTPNASMRLRAWRKNRSFNNGPMACTRPLFSAASLPITSQKTPVGSASCEASPARSTWGSLAVKAASGHKSLGAFSIHSVAAARELPPAAISIVNRRADENKVPGRLLRCDFRN